MAGLRAGFGHFRFQALYNLRIPRAQAILGEERMVHTAEHLASAMFWLGVPRAEIPRACLYAESSRERGPFAVLHPFASAAHKAWPAERFVALARNLRESHALDVVIIGGQGDDYAPFGEFECLQGAPLREVKALLAGASLFVGNDSGPAHMAAAFGLPVVVLYGSSDATVWAPWRTQSEIITAGEGLASVPLERVMTAVERLRART
jgi:ADP-heptose:LPS heptosyltransferase